MIIIAGSASPRLSSQIASILGCRLIVPEERRFPDGELYVRIEADLKDENVAVVQSTCFPQDENLLELYLLLDTAKGLGAKCVEAVVPYLAYSRQDKRFKPGEAVSVRTVSKLMGEAGADELVTVDLHKDEGALEFKNSLINATAMPLIGQYIKRLNLRDPLIVGADRSSAWRAMKVAAEIGAEYEFLEKKRISAEEVVTQPKSLVVGQRDVVIVDDVISTGGTIVEAARILRWQGAREIHAACTHPILVGDAAQNMAAAGVARIIATDTIEKEVSVVSVAPLIAGVLRQDSRCRD